MTAREKGTVVSEDLFPKPDFYEEKPQEEKKLPVDDLAKALSLQEFGDIGVILIQKREEGGFIVVTSLIKQEIAMQQERVIRRTPGLSVLEVALLEALKRFMEARKRG